MDVKKVRVPEEMVVGLRSSEGDQKALNVLTGRNLPPSLDTGITKIDFEHGQLLSCMASLRKMCTDMTRSNCLACESQQHNFCENSLIAILGDLLAFILDHFHTEEKAMRDSLLFMVDRDVCEAHMEDHAHISEKIQQIVAAIDQTKMVVLVRELDGLLERWVSHHTVMHDQALASWIARQDSIMRWHKV